MKTIAISIDEPILERIDRLAAQRGAESAAKKGSSSTRANRSRIVRSALKEWVEREERREREERERAIFGKHRALLERQAKALIADQAKP